MTTARWICSVLLGLTLTAPLDLMNATAAGAAPGSGVAMEGGSASHVPSGAGDDSPSRRSGDGQRTLRQVGDAVFSRPFHFFRLVAGVAALPIALPIAAVFADWHDATDICITGPYWMTFERPLGE